MKTRELIEMLQKEDPSGEMECTIGNAPVSNVYRNPGYWDGCLQKFEKDEKGRISAGMFCSGETKVCLRSLSIWDMVASYTDMPVKYDGEYAEKHYKESIEKWRAQMKDMHIDLEKGDFVRYMKKRLVEHEELDFEGTGDDVDDIGMAAAEFYDNNMSPNDPMPEDLLKMREKRDGHEIIPSWHERRCLQWDREINAVSENGKLVLRKETKPE